MSYVSLYSYSAGGVEASDAFAAFYDIGMVYQDAYSLDTKHFGTGNYNDDWGIGLRLNIPHLGPLRLDYAFPITHGTDTSGSSRFQFSFGYSLPF